MEDPNTQVPTMDVEQLNCAADVATDRSNAYAAGAAATTDGMERRQFTAISRAFATLAFYYRNLAFAKSAEREEE